MKQREFTTVPSSSCALKHNVYPSHAIRLLIAELLVAPLYLLSTWLLCLSARTERLYQETTGKENEDLSPLLYFHLDLTKVIPSATFLHAFYYSHQYLCIDIYTYVREIGLYSYNRYWLFKSYQYTLNNFLVFNICFLYILKYYRYKNDT